MTTRFAAQCFPLWSYIHEEMLERGWELKDLAIAMGGDLREIAVNQLTLEMMQVIRDANCKVGEETAQRLSVAFGVSPEMFINLDNAYRDWLRLKEDSEQA